MGNRSPSARRWDAMDGDLDPMTCHPDCPFRPVDWRWLRAGYLREHGMLANVRRDDRWVRRALAFRARWARAGSDLERAELAEAEPALFGAYHARELGE